MKEDELLYSSTHEWVWIQGNECKVGISRYAVDQLTDVVYIELPAVGRTLAAGEAFGVVESVKAVSDLYCPVDGEVTEINTEVASDPAILGQDPYQKGWLLKLKLSTKPDMARLKNKTDYDAATAAQK